MIIDLHESGAVDLRRYDVCVIGSGPAGMTVASELADSGLSLCVLESGRLRPSRYGDALRRVDSEGITIKDYSRERVLGGASTTWAGLSSPLDAVDMRPRPDLGHEGWPVSREELWPYYEQAVARYRFAPLHMYAPGGFDVLAAKGDVQPGWEAVEEKVFLAAGEPQDFGREQRHIFERPDVDLILDATVQRLEGGPHGRIECAAIATGAGKTATLSAGAFVVATGGIENARLLLASRDLCPSGLGNEHDQVGRFLMNHPKNYHGTIRLARPVRELPYNFGCLYRGFAGYAGLRLRDAQLVEQGLSNHYVRFEPLFPWSDNRGVEALVFLVKNSRGFLKAWKAKRAGEIVTLRDYSETGDDSDLQNERKSLLGWLGLVGLVLIHLPMVLRYVVSRLAEGRAPAVSTIRLRNFMEMEPDPDNRVLLGDQTDVHGQPIPVVRHRPTERDRRSLAVLHEALAADLAKNGLGELESDIARADPWPVDLDASHHMGTTRMGRDAARSVVTPELRLHAVDNVYVAGGSVFPTSGCANPTFTIVALSIRLAEHLRGRLAPDGQGSS